ncbi:hypothetical protein XELAEV_18012777mg [Xenopus laevis]|uniref:Flavodoxin-like domain-containing protein n=1 Tax=Xenopus laevis TaxID=8355 RepID=A0A974DNA7_XENLA|nr:hypothetical protein XELAEV_18012777mg [Xenopus laevis]
MTFFYIYKSTDAWDFAYTNLMFLCLNRFYIYSCAAIGITVWVCSHFIMAWKKHQNEKLRNGSLPLKTKALKSDSPTSDKEQNVYVAGVKIFYGSQTGTAKGFAHLLSGEVTLLGLPVEIINMKQYDPDDNLVEELPTLMDSHLKVQNGSVSGIQVASNDFRFGKTYLKGMRYAVFGLGNSVYITHYNTLWMLSANRVMTRAEGDCNVVKSKHGSIESDFDAWKAKFLSRLKVLLRGEKKPCSGKCKKSKCKSKKKSSIEAMEEEEKHSEHEDSEDETFETTSDSEPEEHEPGSGLIDVEDLGKAMSNMKKAKVRVTEELSYVGWCHLEPGHLGKSLQGDEAKEKEEPREMITPALQEALTKQVYAALKRRLLQTYILWH